VYYGKERMNYTIMKAEPIDMVAESSNLTQSIFTALKK